MINNPRKAQYVLSAAEAFSEVDELWLRNAPYDEVYSWLTDIKGIGDWSANFVMIRGLGRMEKLSGVDEKLAMAVGKIYSGNENSMSEEEVRMLAEKYGKWQGCWAYYLRIYSEFEPGQTMQSGHGSWMQIS